MVGAGGRGVGEAGGRANHGTPPTRGGGIGWLRSDDVLLSMLLWRKTIRFGLHSPEFPNDRRRHHQLKSRVTPFPSSHPAYYFASFIFSGINKKWQLPRGHEEGSDEHTSSSNHESPRSRPAIRHSHSQACVCVCVCVCVSVCVSVCVCVCVWCWCIYGSTL